MSDQGLAEPAFARILWLKAFSGPGCLSGTLKGTCALPLMGVQITCYDADAPPQAFGGKMSGGLSVY